MFLRKQKEQPPHSTPFGGQGVLLLIWPGQPEPDMHTGLSLAKPLKLVEINHNVSIKLTWTVSFNADAGRIATELELWIPGAF